MKTFRDLLDFKREENRITELALASKGNMGDPGWIAAISKTGIINYTKFIDNIETNIGTYELRQYTDKKISDPSFILGYWGYEELETKLGIEKNQKFFTIFAIELSDVKSTLKVQNKTYKNVVKEEGVIVDMKRNFNNKGIAETIYMYLVNKLGYTILGDKEHYFGARKLWSRLSKRIDVTVDILNIKENRVIEENVVLHHGNYNDDFDKRLWTDKEHCDKCEYQSILVKI